MKKFRNLTANEIEVRVSTVTDKGCSLLLYKDARVDMNVLDETVGAENWQREHTVVNGNLFCTVSIKVDGEWISKQDVGVESYTEKEKGQASDAFKRACVNWGIGRELYTAPFIRVKNSDVKLEVKDKRYTTRDKFEVVDIEISKDKQIQKLLIRNKTNGRICYTYGAGNPQILEPQQPEPEPVCTKCGNKIKEVSNGKKTLSALEVSNNTGGLCLDCYKKTKSE